MNVLQIGFLFLPQRLAVDFARLDPLQGLRRIFSGGSMVHLGFGIVKLLVVLGVSCVAIYGQRTAMLELSGLAPAGIAVQMGQILFFITLKIGAALLVLAILDYAYQWWRHQQDLKMTPQELREELRNLEGNPHMIARRKQVRRDLVLERISGLVSQANVVLTNPSQLAIALRYDPATMSAPVVVAKGSGASAQQIHRAAAEHGIPAVEQKQLARALYRRVDPNQPIPADQYVAVAEVLTRSSGSWTVTNGQTRGGQFTAHLPSPLCFGIQSFACSRLWPPRPSILWKRGQAFPILFRWSTPEWKWLLRRTARRSPVWFRWNRPRHRACRACMPVR